MVMIRIFTPNLSDNWRIGRGYAEALEGVLAAFFGSVARDIGKFGKKEIGSSGVSDDLAKNYISNAFHWGENQKRGL